MNDKILSTIDLFLQNYTCIEKQNQIIGKVVLQTPANYILNVIISLMLIGKQSHGLL